MTESCAAHREHLGAYADGELESAARLTLSRHLASCQECERALDDIRQIGDVLRSRPVRAPRPAELESLMAGVISRARAEAALSWEAVFRRATGDWHWALTGLGSLSAALVSLLVVAVVCSVSPSYEQDDSLAALLNRLESPAAGRLFIMATAVGRDQAPMLMEFGAGPADASMDSVVFPRGFAGPSRSDLALKLTETVIGPDGRVANLRSMSQIDRQQTEALLGEIRRRWVAPSGLWSGQLVNVEGVAYVTNTRVRGKAL